MEAPNDPIEKLLRERDDYVPDEGFTQGVIARLPRRRSLFPKLLLLAVAIGGGIAAICWLPWGSLPTLEFSLDLKVFSAWLPFGVVIAAVVSAVLQALRRED
jgi:hypothetical protein